MPAGSAPTKTLPIVVVEDIRLLRDGISAMLRSAGLRVVASIRSGEDAVLQILQARPRIVLIDSALGNREGAHLVEAVTRASPDVKVVVMDMRPAQQDVVDFVRAGVRGFILSDATAADIIGTLREVADGHAVLPLKLADVLFSHVAHQHAPRRDVPSAERLTQREREIVQLVAEGATNKEIASRLNIAVHTVKSHVHSVLEKLMLHSRLEIANYAHGFGAAARE